MMPMAKGQSSGGSLLLLQVKCGGSKQKKSTYTKNRKTKQSFLLAAIAVVVVAIKTPTCKHTHIYANPSHKARYYSCFVFHSFFLYSLLCIVLSMQLLGIFVLCTPAG